MNCKYCQAELAEDSVFCNKCGMRQDEPAQEEAAEVIPEEEMIPEEIAEETVETAEVEESAESAEEISEEAAEETEEEQPVAPRKKTWIKVTAAALCVVLLLGLAAGIWMSVNGGFGSRANDLYYKDCYTVADAAAIKAMDNVVATCGDAKLTNSQLQVYYWMQFFSFLENYGSYLSYIGLDYTKPLSEQYVDETQTWEQYFLEMGLNNWHRFQAVLCQAEAEGFEMPASVEEYVAQLPAQMEQTATAYGYASVNELLAQDMGVGCTIDDYVIYMGLYAKSVEYMDHLYARFTPTQEQVREYVTANAAYMMEEYKVSLDSGNLVDVRHILIQPEGCEFDENRFVVATEDQWEACRLEAQAILDSWKAGTADEASFANLAMVHSVDGSASTGGIYTDVYKGQMVENFENWCFDESRKTGDTGLVRTEYGYHIMYFVAAEEGWLRYGTEAYIADACNALIDEAMAAYPMEVNFKNIALGTALSMVTEEAK